MSNLEILEKSLLNLEEVIVSHPLTDHAPGQRAWSVNRGGDQIYIYIYINIHIFIYI